MLVELSIVPLGCDVQWSDQLAEALKLVDASGLPFVLTPSGTCIEGQWDEVMNLVRQCHERVRQSSPHVLTSTRVEDEEGARPVDPQHRLGRGEARPPAPQAGPPR